MNGLVIVFSAIWISCGLGCMSSKNSDCFPYAIGGTLLIGIGYMIAKAQGII